MSRSLPLALAISLISNLGNIVFGQVENFYPFHKFNQNDGLSSYNIIKITQDKYGFVWVGTQDGLNCFDGNKFLVFNNEADQKYRLNGKNVMDVAEDPERNLLWVTTSYNGINSISTLKHIIEPLSAKDTINLSFNNQWIHALCVVSNILWIGTYNGLYGYNLNTHRFLTLNCRILKSNQMRVGKLKSDSKGHVWVCCDGQGIFIFNGKDGTFLDIVPEKALNLYGNKKSLIFWNISISEDNKIALATNWGIRFFELNSLSGNVGNSANVYFPSEAEVFSCAFDKFGNIWFSDIQGLHRFDLADRRLIKISESPGKSDTWQTVVYSLYVDAGNNIWLGTQEGLAYFMAVIQPFSRYYKSWSSSVKIQHAFSLFTANDSIVYCGAANGLYQINTKQYSISNIDEGGSCYLVREISRDKLLVSNSRGTFIRVDNQLVPVGVEYPVLVPLQNDLLCSLLSFNDSITVFASELHKGLYVWNRSQKTLKIYNDGNSQLKLDDGIINELYKDRNGNLWVLSVSSICRFNPIDASCEVFHLNVPGTKTNCSILFDMCETTNSYWVAAYGMGILELTKNMQLKRIIGEKQGLCNNGVYRIFSDNDSLLLVTTNNGLGAINVNSNNIKNYYESDGLHSNAFEQFCGFNYNGSIYAGGVNGFTIIRPDRFKLNSVPPKLYFVKITLMSREGASDTTDLMLSTLNIPNSIYQTNISFAGLNYSNPARTIYSYKINELNTDWIQLGTQNFINLIGISPGNYTLQVRAANEDSIWTKQPLELTLRFQPKWYQTLWFKLLVIAGMVSVFFGFYKFRVAQLKRQQQIRREIANDLHDDLGSTLNTVKVLTHIAKRDANNKSYLDQIEVSLSIATSGLRDMIWVLDDTKDNIKDFFERVKKSVLPASIAHSIELNFLIEGGVEDRVLSKTEKRNLLMIVKESINNSIKYSNCKKIEVRIMVINNKTELTIYDDGKGFDTNIPSEGNGLKNMRYRAKQIHYQINIQSVIGQGTKIGLIKG